MGSRSHGTMIMMTYLSDDNEYEIYNDLIVCAHPNVNAVMV